MQNAQQIYLQTIEALLEENEIEKAFDALLELDKQTQAGIRSDVILHSGSYNEANKMFTRNIISFEEFQRASAKTRFGLLAVMKDVPERIENDAQIRSLNTFQFKVPDNVRLEKVIGGQSNLLKINWLEKALRSAKAVCRVVCEDGNMGTGFLTQDGYIFTNNHVLQDKNTADAARIEFNYEMDSSGSIKTRSSYKLDNTDFICSPPDEFDFARVRVKDNPSNPLSQWGFVEFDVSAIPTIAESVTIIQHPKGEDKQIALNANEVVSVWDRHIFYTTDTEPGSSGSPVFNKEWKVVAIHHAGKTDAEGGVQINAKGDRKGANRGILFEKIFEFIANYKQTDGTKNEASEAPKIHPKTHESTQIAENPAITTILPVEKTQPTPVFQPKIEELIKEKPVFNPIPRFIILYDLNDSKYAKALAKHLAVLKFTKKLRMYDIHSDVKPGEDTYADLQSALLDAKYVFGLITPNFTSNEDILNITLNLPKNITLIPLKIETTDLDGTGIEKVKSLPSLNKFVTDFASIEAGFADIAENVKKLIG
jgi:V8-like Glu-specific endopeptidase